MTDQQSAIDDILGGFVSINDDHPAVADFGASVVEHVAARPSPAAPAPFDLGGRIAALEQKLDRILVLLEGSPQ